MFVKTSPIVRETEGHEDIRVLLRKMRRGESNVCAIFEVEVEDPDYAFCGGLWYYNKSLKEYCISCSRDYATLSLHDSYTYQRIFPQECKGESYISSLYVNLPLFFVRKGEENFGLLFRPFIEKENTLIPFFITFSFRGEKLVFSINLLNPFEVWRKKAASFANWQEGGWKNPEKIYFQPSDTFVFKTVVFRRKFEDIVRKIYEDKALKTHIDTSFHFNKAYRHLVSVWEDENGVFDSSNPRFLRKSYGLHVTPLFDTLVSDTYLFSKFARDSGRMCRLSERYKNFLLGPQMSVALNGEERAWHNYVRFDKAIRFTSIYNTGIGGFPGGQATIVRALFRRYLAGDHDEKLLRYATQGAHWLSGAMFEDGHWGRSYVIPALKYDAPSSDTGKESFSVGANAEGSLALFLAYEAVPEDVFRETALKALDYANNFLEPGPVAFGYLRDNKMREPDGISAVFAVMANVEGYRIMNSQNYLERALMWGYYLLTWVRMWELPGFKVDWSMDPLAYSFKPRVSSYETSLSAAAFFELFKATKDAFWRAIAENVFASIDLENQYRGYSEGLYISLDRKLKTVHFESSYATSAVLNFLLSYCGVLKTCDISIPQKRIKSIVSLDGRERYCPGDLFRIVLSKFRNLFG